MISFLSPNLIFTIYSVLSKYTTHAKIDEHKNCIECKIESDDCNKSKDEIEMILIIDIQPKFLKC